MLTDQLGIDDSLCWTRNILFMEPVSDIQVSKSTQ